MLSKDVFLGVVDAAPLVAMDLVVVRGGTEILLGLQLADLLVPPRHMGAFEHFYTDCFAGDVGVSTHYVVMGNLIALPAGAELTVADAQHSALRWWPLAEAQASDDVHRFTKDYVDAILLSKI
ncbi:hypothetical protein RAE19_13260 [Rhodoferax sp. TBRC 17660]|uniref:Nudix hydrolase domain-containing protein n=1 Tax=Rhodoferax potami TaxID=3068338 RepID=A0ABU3KQ01_9BURK|nr:hypothetical protein [Rhodoferax sp. TBRC 17660]MDT7519668.1 hypothetical protein [Rhodoferax sp. TBRC 17660]